MSGQHIGQTPQGHGPPPHSGPPYPTRNASLGGLPDIIPDIPATAVFLFLYVVFAITHINILKKNQKRGHKFLFSGALFGFCMIRIMTMSLRIAWACNRINISLAIAAQIFVYVGTIILYIINWFFTQRIVRAQHPRWGWSQPYRVLHRVALVCLIICLLMLVVAAIQQFFTLSDNIRRIDRNLQITGQTYFAAFCFAPLVLMFVSHIVPRRGTEKFGAGRLTNNITILLLAVVILSIGQIFRCVTTWLPPAPLRNVQGRPLPVPWYFSKACFYIFNFVTEIFVVILYAAFRVDLRFHIPDGSNGPGAYRAGRESQYHVDVVGDEQNLKRASTEPIADLKLKHPNKSTETLEEYEGSLFDDTRTLADSLRYPSSVLEVDSKTGHWKIKRASRAGSSHTRMSQASEHSSWSPDRDTYVPSNMPPVPDMPVEWPLRESQLPRGSIPVMEHRNSRNTSAGGSSHGSREIESQDMDRLHMSSAIADAIAKLEENSEANKKRHGDVTKDQPPDYDAITPIYKRPFSDFPIKKTYQPGSDIPRKHTYRPSPLSSSLTSAPDTDIPPKNNNINSIPAGSAKSAGPELPKKQHYSVPTPPRAASRSPHQSLGEPKALSSDSARTRNTSFETAQEEFRRFSFEAPPPNGEEGYEGGSESEREWERRGRQA